MARRNTFAADSPDDPIVVDAASPPLDDRHRYYSVSRAGYGAIEDDTLASPSGYEHYDDHYDHHYDHHDDHGYEEDHGYHDYHYHEEKKCCPHVVGAKGFALLLATIPVVVAFLNMQITMFIMRRKRRKRAVVGRSEVPLLYLKVADDFVRGRTIPSSNWLSPSFHPTLENAFSIIRPIG